MNKVAERCRFPAMLDVGTGTGVLAIAGKALGARFTVGIDIDPAAVFVARRNVGLNAGLPPIPGEADSSVHLLVSGMESIKGVFDIVAANLAAPTILNLRDSLVAATGQLLILSGIADAMAREVVVSYSSAGCPPIMLKRRDGWNAALLETKAPCGKSGPT
jgi:ribosomal protein L11 methyltransferase